MSRRSASFTMGPRSRGTSHADGTAPALSQAGPPRPPVVMTIAGSDSGGGAGVQADLRTFAALGVYGTCVITVVTAQNTLRVLRIHDVPPDFIRDQMDTVLADIPADAVKTGMLASTATIVAVAEAIGRWRLAPVVVDPVMVATSGDRLLREDALEALRRDLLPLATLVTPNLPEAEALVGRALRTPEEVRQAARDILRLGPRAVVIKGGHRAGPPVDVFYDGRELREFQGPRVHGPETHGTGCTYSAAIAAFLARGYGLPEAVEMAKAFVTEAIRASLPMGQGERPADQLFALRGAPDAPWTGRRERAGGSR